jgi:hypothetical protein
MSRCPSAAPFLAPPPPLLFLRYRPSPRRRRRGGGHQGSRPLLILARFDPPLPLRLNVSNSSDCPAETHHGHHVPLLLRPRALIVSLAPLWREGLFLVRCSVFAAVVAVAAALTWLAQLRARSLV